MRVHGEEGVKSEIEEQGGEWAPLFETVGHVDNGVVPASQNRPSLHVVKKGRDGVDDPLWRADAVEQGEQVASRQRDVGRLKVVQKEHL